MSKALLSSIFVLACSLHAFGADPISPRFVEQYWLKKGQSPAAALKELRAGGVGVDGRPTVMFDKQGKKHPVRNQGEVLDLFDKGYQPLSTSEIVTCHYLSHQRTALQQMAKAKPSLVSYLHSLKVDRAFVELLPASLWSKLNFYYDGKNILTASDNDKRLLDTLKPKKITPYASGRQGVGIDWPREYSPDAVWNMCITPLGTGDFNADGVEDMLISIYQGDGRLFPVGPILLTRYSKDGLLELAAVGEFPSQYETKRYQIAVHHLCQEEGCVACSNYLMAVRDKTTGRSFRAIGKTINSSGSLSFKGYECSHKGKTYRLVFQGAKPSLTVTDAPKKQASPKTVVPKGTHQTVVVVAMKYPGQDAKTVEREVGKVVADAVNGVKGVKALKATCAAGAYRLEVVFEDGTGIAMAEVLVQNRISQIVTKLPKAVTQSGITVKAKP